MLGLGSSYRTIGEYEQSQKIFRKAIELFPENLSFQVFYSMTLYNLGEHNEAMQRLLKCLLETTSDEKILQYQKAIQFYANALDETWV